MVLCVFFLGAGISVLNHRTLLNQICCWQYKMENFERRAEEGLINGLHSFFIFQIMNLSINVVLTLMSIHKRIHH